MTTTPNTKFLSCLTAIVKPEQSGKTFEMIEKIISDRKKSINSNIIPIDIIFTDLNITLVNQTISRLQEKLIYTDEEETQLKELFKNHNFMSFNSKDKQYKNKDSVLSQIREDYDYLRNTDSDSESDIDDSNNIDGTIIACCCHKQRWTDIFGDDIKNSIIYKINRLKTTTTKFKFTIWCDEFDIYIKHIEHYIRPFTENKKIDITINGLSATIEKVYKRYDTFQIQPLKKTYIEELYHNWDDNKIFEEDKQTSIFEFIEFIFNKYYDESDIGSKWFIPGNRSIESHIKIRDLCLSKNMCVFVKNTSGIILYIPGQKHIKIVETEKKPDGQLYSFSELLSKYIQDNELNSYQFAITGYKCISRGVSIQSNEFLFDNAILYDISDETVLSQMAGRLSGNIKKEENYDEESSINVYTTKKFNKKMKKMRYISENLACYAYEKDNINPSFVTKIEYNDIKSKCNSKLGLQEEAKEPIIEKFNTQSQLKEHFKNNLKHIFGGYGPQKKSSDRDGFYKGAFRNGLQILSVEEVYQERKWGFSSTIKWRSYPCYKNTGDPSTLEWWIIYYI